MVLKPPFVIPKKSYSYFSSFLHHASDHSANFLTVLAGRTVKLSPSPRGPGLESRRPHQKCHQSTDYYVPIYVIHLSDMFNNVEKNYTGLRTMMKTGHDEQLFNLSLDLCLQFNNTEAARKIVKFFKENYTEIEGK